MRAGPAGAVALLFLVLSGVYWFRLGGRPLQRWDEGLYAAVTRNMLHYDSFLLPVDQEGKDWSDTGRGRFWYPKPPLVNWIGFPTAKMLGFTNMALRLPYVAALLGLLVVIYGWGRHIDSRIFGACAAIAFGTMSLVVDHGRTANIETPLIFFGLLGGLLYVKQLEAKGRARIGYALAAGAAFGCALLTKQVVAALFVPILIGAELTSRPKPIRERVLGFGVFVGGALLVAGWWFLAAYVRVGDELWQRFLSRNVVERLSAERSSGGLANYWALMTKGAVPFHPLLGGAGVLVWSRELYKRQCLKRFVPLVLYFGVAIWLFGVRTPRLLPWYLLHVMPLVAFGVAAVVVAIGKALGNAVRREEFGLGIGLLLLAGVGFFGLSRHASYQYANDPWERAAVHVRALGDRDVVLDQHTRKGRERIWYFGPKVRVGKLDDCPKGGLFVTYQKKSTWRDRARLLKRLGRVHIVEPR